MAILDIYNTWMQEKRFVCASLLYAKKGRKHIYGTILKLDDQDKSMLIYDDDSKSVVSVGFNEIDDINLSETKKG